MTAFRAPGRVNLIGDHTDYNEGFVLPLAIDLECVVRAAPSSNGATTLRSLDLRDEAMVRFPADGGPHPSVVEPSWGRYAAGVASVLAGLGRSPVAVDATVSSTIPIGAGLSSSAALEVAVALALCDAAAFELPTVELARACQRAELVATGVPCGVMDQLASLAGRESCALLIDCRTLQVTPIPIPDSLAVVVVHSGLPRALAGSAYAERRAACEAAAARLGLRSLRDATPEQVADDPRARHVVAENDRVQRAARALEAKDIEALGLLLTESHASLRDDFEVSTPELDALVCALDDAGALGSRLTGAGFGGCVVALARRDDAADVARRAADAYRSGTGRAPAVHLCRAVAGAGRLRPDPDPIAAA